MTTRAFDRQKTPEADRYDGIILVPAPTRQRLNEKQRVNYRDHRRRFVRWLLAFGKDPDTAEGYARDVVERRAHDTEAFYRWVWDHRADGYTTVITTDQADELVEEYADAEHRRERREIENRVLAETVWQVPENQGDHEGDFVSKHYEIDRIRQKLPDDAIEANRLLKKHRTEDR
ncbi:hypothetical protein DU504_14170 [Haloplanus salinus]|uniref:Site-specific integrase n=1 Tax=Haloplanus salinus TaxID=1126245 RepID=A0A368NDR2_9EURY|nr:hypothetical protein [Haloplanus salinus]RCU48346.1 hypothetical protein DU504_14170 [Haloplanus salinus]